MDDICCTSIPNLQQTMCNSNEAVCSCLPCALCCAHTPSQLKNETDLCLRHISTIPCLKKKRTNWVQSFSKIFITCLSLNCTLPAFPHDPRDACSEAKITSTMKSWGCGKSKISTRKVKYNEMIKTWHGMPKTENTTDSGLHFDQFHQYRRNNIATTVFASSLLH